MYVEGVHHLMHEVPAERRDVVDRFRAAVSARVPNNADDAHEMVASALRRASPEYSRRDPARIARRHMAPLVTFGTLVVEEPRT